MPELFRVGGIGHYSATPVSEASEQSWELEASPAPNIEDKRGRVPDLLRNLLAAHARTLQPRILP